MKVIKKSSSKRKYCCLFLISLLMILGLQIPAYASSVSVAVADSSVKLLKEAMRSAGKDQNVLISPDSILTAMAMAENGAAGKTLSEMESALGNVPVRQLSGFLSKLHRRLSGSADWFTYSPANSVWYKKGSVTLKKSYLNKMSESFHADIYPSSFDGETVRKINAWVNEKTFGKIPSILNSIRPQDRVILVNAVYFKGEWAEQYSGTTQRKFTKASGKIQKARMLEGVEHAYVKICGAKGFVKSYRGGQTAFMALLPPRGTSVQEYVNQLSGRELINGYKNRMTRNVIVRTRLPEFSYDYSISLRDPLRSMGIRRAFSAGNADFSKMSETGMRIDDVIHKTHIELTKTGTEAAAATAVVCAATSVGPGVPPTVRKVYLDRPFVYAILDVKSGVPLFIGVLNRV